MVFLVGLLIWFLSVIMFFVFIVFVSMNNNDNRFI